MYIAGRDGVGGQVPMSLKKTSEEQCRPPKNIKQKVCLFVSLTYATSVITATPSPPEIIKSLSFKYCSQEFFRYAISSTVVQKNLMIIGDQGFSVTFLTITDSDYFKLLIFANLQKGKLLSYCNRDLCSFVFRFSASSSFKY